MNKEVFATLIVLASNVARRVPEMKTENIWGFTRFLFLKATLPFHIVIFSDFLLKETNNKTNPKRSSISMTLEAGALRKEPIIM